MDICDAMIKKQTHSKDTYNRKKQLAYILYVENGLEQKVISGIIGVSEVSISNWKKADRAKGKDWDEDRDELKHGFDNERRRIKKFLIDIFDNIQARKAPKNVPNTAESDSINKLTIAAKNLQANYVTLNQKSEVGKLFILHLQKTVGQSKAVEVIEYWHDFIMASI